MPDVREKLTAALSDRYAVEREIGSGGMATVFLAEDLKHHRKVAVKVLRPELASLTGPERFHREIEVAAQLTHPHILPLHDSGEAGGFLYYVMPYIEGQSLRDRLASGGEFPISEAVGVLREISDALASAHRHGVVHRDIKPDNVLLAERHAMVTDFGVAKAVSEATGNETLTTAGLTLGTPSYMAPEQAAGDGDIDHRADIYAVGVLAYELLAGKPPFTGPTSQAIIAGHLTRPPEPVADRRPEVPPALAAVVMQCLEKDPADRWQSADELTEAFDALRTPAEGTAAHRAEPVGSGRRRLAWAGAIAVVVLGTAAAVALRPSPDPALDPNLLAVAPFDVLGGDHVVWGEGLGDLISNGLDGAGPLRTVSPSIVLKDWSGRADAASTAQLGARVGAGLGVYGRLVADGTDAVRLTATLFDVPSENRLREFEVRGLADAIPQLADSLVVQLLGELTIRRSLGAVEMSSIGSNQPSAIREYLQGEQYFRRFQLDSAGAHYRRAVDLDSTFALAWHRVGGVIGWTSVIDAVPYYQKAAEFSRGLAPRESLRLAADSLYGAVFEHSAGGILESPQWSMLNRLMETLAESERRYPNDPWMYYRLADTKYHFGYALETTFEEVYRDFTQTVAIDPGLGGAYPHLLPMAFGLEGEEGGRRTVDAYLALNPLGLWPDAARRIREVFDEIDRNGSVPDSSLSDVPLPMAARVVSILAPMPDSAEVAVQLARQITDPNIRQTFLPLTLISRGRLAEAWSATNIERVPSHIRVELAGVGLLPADSMAAVADDWTWRQQWDALRLWTDLGDATRLDRFAERVRRIADADTAATEAWRRRARYYADVAPAFAALAHGDSAAALDAFQTVPKWRRCRAGCYAELLTEAQLLIAAGRDEDALTILHSLRMTLTDVFQYPSVMAWRMERARVNERLGNIDDAVWEYAYVADMWRNADPLLQDVVTEARDALVRLRAEGR